MKKLFTALFSLILALTLAFGAFSALMGDVDLNGKITASDARAVLRYSAKLTTLTRDQLAVSDINSDSRVTAADARIILRISAKLENINDYIKEPETKTDTEITTSKSSVSDIKLTSNEIYTLAKEYTLTIKATDKDGKTAATGTGFYINKNGWIATNYHVIKDAYKITAADGNMNDYDVTRVVAYSQLKDIAIISVGNTPGACAVFSSNYATGDTIYTLGSPLGLELTFTSGMISQSNRNFYELNDGISYIQMTAPITIGNSGSPLIDEYGNVIGICSMTYMSAQNMNFAIPIGELSALDTSNPITLPAFYSRVHSGSDSNDFTGIMLPASDSITVTRGGTCALYVIGIANGDYSVEYSVSNTDFSVIRGGTYGNVTMFYITSSANKSSAELKLWFDRLPSKVKTVALKSTTAESAPVYSGIKGNVPDFGAMCAVSPFTASDSTADNTNTYAFYYDLNSVIQSGLSEDKAVSGYAELLSNNGFTLTASDEKNFKYSFENTITKTTVTVSKESSDSKTYICILIKY